MRLKLKRSTVLYVPSPYPARGKMVFTQHWRPASNGVCVYVTSAVLKSIKSKDDFREAPFWNVLVLYGYCPNSFGPPPLCQTGKREKSAPNHPGQPLHPPSPYGEYPYGGNTFQKGASLIKVFFNSSYHQGLHLEIGIVCWKSGMQLSLLSK